MLEYFNISQIAVYASWLFIVLGSFFILVGTLGLLRMPDVFTRMHAASVSDTLGAGFLVLGLMVQAGLTLVTVKLIFILGLLFMTGPVATHALAQAALFAGAKPILKEDRRDRPLADQIGEAAEAASEKTPAAQSGGSPS